MTTTESCIARGDSMASIAGGNPTAEGTATVAAAGVDISDLLAQVTPVVTQLVGTVCTAVPTTLPALPTVGPITVPAVTPENCALILNGLLSGLGQPVSLTVGDSSGKVVTDANRVTATGTAAGATVNLLNIPPPAAGVTGQVCSGPIAKVTVGDSRATAVYNRGSTESTSSVDPALVTVDLCLITTNPDPIRLAVGQSFTVPGTDITVTAASGRTFRGSAGAEANAASVTGLGGQLALRIAGAFAIVDGGRPAAPPAEVSPVGDLPRTGSDMPPWTPVAGFGILAVAALSGRMLLRARRS